MRVERKEALALLEGKESPVTSQRKRYLIESRRIIRCLSDRQGTGRVYRGKARNYI